MRRPQKSRGNSSLWCHSWPKQNNKCMQILPKILKWMQFVAYKRTCLIWSETSLILHVVSALFCFLMKHLGSYVGNLPTPISECLPTPISECCIHITRYGLCVRFKCHYIVEVPDVTLNNIIVFYLQKVPSFNSLVWVGHLLIKSCVLTGGRGRSWFGAHQRGAED